MTMEEAIKELEEDKALYMPDEWIEALDRDTADGRLITALDMAISALMFTEKIAKLHNCNDCRIKYICPHCPRWGDTVRYNCFRWRGEKE